MAGDEMANRLEVLEITVEGLTGLPGQVRRLDARIESLDRQFLHFREEVGGEFSAVRREAAGEFAAVRGEMATGFTAVRREMAAGFAAVRQEMATEFTAVRREMKADSAETRGQIVNLHDQMFKLHEEVMGQIAILQVDGRETRAQLLALYESLRADIRSLRER
jgi:hypothetical protein